MAMPRPSGSSTALSAWVRSARPLSGFARTEANRKKVLMIIPDLRRWPDPLSHTSWFPLAMVFVLLAGLRHDGDDHHHQYDRADDGRSRDARTRDQLLCDAYFGMLRLAASWWASSPSTWAYPIRSWPKLRRPAHRLPVPSFLTRPDSRPAVTPATAESLPVGATTTGHFAGAAPHP